MRSLTPRPTVRAPGRPRMWRLLLSLVTSVLVALPLTSSPAQAALPSKHQWYLDTFTALHGSRDYVGARVAKAQERGESKLAINLDIDNTSLASHYDYGQPVAVTLRLAQYAREHHVTLLFNTGRVEGDGRLRRATRQLEAAGYDVGLICGRGSSREPLADSKQGCRQHFVDLGYTIIANVGNRSTDFTGGNYERAYKLPNYDNQLA